LAKKKPNLTQMQNST